MPWPSFYPLLTTFVPGDFDRFTLRLRKGISDRLWEDLVLAAVGDQFDEREGVVGVVLSVRAAEDVLSVWTERSDGPSGGNKLK